jgi:uncharacterized protein (TIGR03790 family)
MTVRRLIAWAGVLAALGAGGADGVAWALEARDVAVVFNTRSVRSLNVARHYMAARGIPETHLVPLTCDPAENITEAAYRTSVVPQLVAQLKQRKLAADERNGVAGVKCLVTTCDVPLRILAHEPTAAERAELAEDQKQLERVVALLAEQLAAYEKLAPAAGAVATASAPGGTASGPATGAGGKPTLAQVLGQLNTAIQGAARRIGQLSEPARSQAMGQLIALQQKVAGPAGLIRLLQVQGDAPGAEAGRQQLQEMSKQVSEWQQQYLDLAKQREVAKNRQEMIAVQTTMAGMVGQAQALTELVAYLQPEGTAACFDNELALLLTDQSYPRTNWVVNPRNVETYPMVTRTAARTTTPSPQVLLVARLDGSSEAKVKEMIDTTLKVEAKGLEGKLYLDARGLRGTDAYAAFDADLRRAAQWMKEHATIATVLDDRPELLEAKDCPEAALYCGWYSLHNYMESGQWVPGAVGYHVASYEMGTLHDPKETGWVVNLLNRGFCGTLGATDEPYLHAFPKPSLFFPLLCCGEFTQGEAWELTAPLLGWRVGYVGDPLYNPFKKKPAVKVEDVKGDTVMKRAWEVLGR